VFFERRTRRAVMRQRFLPREGSLTVMSEGRVAKAIGSPIIRSRIIERWIGAVTDPRGSSRRNVARFASPWTVSRRRKRRGMSSGGRPVERRSAPPSVVRRSRHRCSIGSPQAVSSWKPTEVGGGDRVPAPRGARTCTRKQTPRDVHASGRTTAGADRVDAPRRLKHEAQPRASPVRSSKDGSPSERGHGFVAMAPTWQHEGHIACRRRLRKQAPPVLTESEANMIRRTISRIERCVDLIVRRFDPGNRDEEGETLRVERYTCV
jgi:hypothetical protein